MERTIFKIEIFVHASKVEDMIHLIFPNEGYTTRKYETKRIITEIYYGAGSKYMGFMLLPASSFN